MPRRRHGTPLRNRLLGWKWNGKKELAAVLVAADTSTDQEILRAVGCAERTLNYWKQAPAFQAKVAEHRGELVRQTMLGQADVLRELWAIALSDPGDLVEYRRTCCRHCWGQGHGYQYTQGEWADMLARQALELGKDNHEAPDPAGGTGFDARKGPHPECPNCWGDGLGRVHLRDTRVLAREQRSALAGIKQTRHGIEIKFRSKEDALQMLGRSMGMFLDRVRDESFDLSSLSADELEQLERIRSKIAKPSGDTG